jgi:hypothetical protein
MVKPKLVVLCHNSHEKRKCERSDGIALHELGCRYRHHVLGINPTASYDLKPYGDSGVYARGLAAQRGLASQPEHGLPAVSTPFCLDHR